MTRRKTPKNSTIVIEALKKEDKFSTSRQLINGHYGIGDKRPFIFPNDLDKIQPDSINGNLTIKYPQ